MYWLKEDNTWFEESIVQNRFGTFCFLDQLDLHLQKGFGCHGLLYGVIFHMACSTEPLLDCRQIGKGGVAISGVLPTL